MTAAPAPVPAAASPRVSPLLRRRPPRLPAGLTVLPDEARTMGCSVWGTRGSGKSRLLGRLIAWQDFFKGVPLVIIDPIGGTIDHFFDKISRRPARERAALWTRVRYVSMAGRAGRVIPFPIWSPVGAERPSDTAQRYLDVLTRTDPELIKAPVQGLNALAPLASAAGLVLPALGLGITEAASLISEPGRWQPRLARLAGERPQLAAPIGELLALYALSPREREVRTATFKAKLGLFRFSENFQAIFGADRMGLSWPDAVKYRQAILLDFRDIHSAPLKKFSLLWVYASLLTFIKQRGHGRHTPISLIIDELSFLVGSAAVNTDLLAADLDELINRISRSHAVWLTLAGQELFQLPEQLRQTVLSTGTVLFGQTSDYQTAEELARRYYTYDPYKVKKYEAVHGVVEPVGSRYLSSPAVHGIVDWRTTEFSPWEQNYLHSRHFLTLPAFHFLLGRSRREGQLPTHLEPISTAKLDPGQFPDTRHVECLRSQLMVRDGVVEQVVLAQIRRRLPRLPGQIRTDRTGSAGRPAAAPSRGDAARSPSDATGTFDVPTAVTETVSGEATTLLGGVVPDQQPGEDQLISRHRSDEQEGG